MLRIFRQSVTTKLFNPPPKAETTRGFHSTWIPDGKKRTYNDEAKTLAELGYKFHNGKLVQMDGREFKYIDKEHYEFMSDLLAAEIQRMMKWELGMVEAFVPETGPDRANIFHSDDLFKNEKGLVVLICGSGAVRAGQWSRLVCANDSLDNGSMLPYLNKAHALGCATLVMNPNFTTSAHHIPEFHALHVWDNFVAKSPAKRLVVVAHSYGGVVFKYLITKREAEVVSKVRAVAFTDSVHIADKTMSLAARNFLYERCCDWVASSERLGTTIEERDPKKGCKTVSAGTKLHEYTSGLARSAVFTFIEMAMKSKL